MSDRVDVAGLMSLVREATGLGAEHNMAVDLRLTLGGIAVMVTGASSRTGQSYSDLRRVTWETIKASGDVSTPVLDAVRAGIEAVRQRTKALR